MAEVHVPLQDGLKVGDDLLKDVILRDPTAGDIIDANAESERMVLTPAGPALVPSPSLVGANMLRRQIKSIGNVQGPISLVELKRLTERDLALLQSKADEMDQAMVSESAAKELASRGRADGPAE
jgi:phage FluMu protein gp41